MFTDRNSQDEIWMWARARERERARERARPLIALRSLMQLQRALRCTESLSSHLFFFYIFFFSPPRPCWRHKGSCALMCPTSPSTWASQGNSSTLVRPSTPPASRKKHHVTLLLPPDAWIMFFNLLCLSSLVSLPRPPPPRLSFPLFYRRPRFTPASSLFMFYSSPPVFQFTHHSLFFCQPPPHPRLLLHHLYLFLLLLLLRSLSPHPGSACRLRIGRGGPGRRPAALLRQGVLVVPAHVEPHAAAPLPQPVGAGGADVAEQEVCHGRTHTQMDKLDTNLKKKKKSMCDAAGLEQHIVRPVGGRLSRNPQKDGQL